jgi:ElaB/YqjD/DUF883 family membrane-anchored ribosome-binding protein
MSESTSSQLEQGWQNLRVDVGKLRSDLAEIAQALMETGKMEASEAKSRMQEMAQQRLDDIRKVLDTAKERSRDATDVLKQQVEQKPLMSMAVAFGAGILLGVILNRK